MRTFLIITAALLASSPSGAQPKAAEQVTLLINPHFRTEITLPAPIVRYSGTRVVGGFSFSSTGPTLIIRPVTWPKDDPRFQQRTVLNVYTNTRAWQLNIDYDFDLTDHILFLGFDEKPRSEPAVAASPQAPNDPLDNLFIRFITNGGVLAFMPHRTTNETFKTPTGTVTLTSVYTHGNHLFMAGELTDLRVALPLTPVDLQNLALYRDHAGQVYTPAALPRAVTAPTEKPVPSTEPIPIFYLYAVRTQR